MYPPSAWRLLIHGAASGAANMAVDEAILSALLDGRVPPTLRFFAWEPPCLSLGRSQPASDVDWAACRADGVDVVRRPTGGRAILHTDELTYSVALLQADPRAEGGVIESYRRLSEGLLAGLRALGADVAQAAVHRRPPGEQTAICFETPSAYEITAGGRKLVGSAQWRARGGVLQHGSLPLYGDLGRIVSYLALSEEQRAAERCTLGECALTLEEAVGRPVSFDEAAAALASGLASALNLTLVPGTLTDYERALTRTLERAI
jgi:lipoate-protein ligase A